MSTSTSSSTSSIFSGSSRFSSDLQSVITRAVNIASLPITQLSQQKIKLQDQSAALISLQSTFTSLAGSVTSLSSAASKSGVMAYSSDATIANPTSYTSGQVGKYTLAISDLGSYSTSISKSSLTAVSDPATAGFVSGDKMTLTVDGVPTYFTPTGTSMNAVVSAINGANAGVQATVVNLGSSSSPSYRLSLESTKLGAVAIGLSDNGTSMVDSQTTGAMAKYTLNGSDTISTDSRTVVVAPDLSVDMVAQGTATVTVATSSTALQSALQAFVTNYNSAVDGLDAQRGQSGGALAGDSTVTSLGNSLHQVANFSYNGMTLADLGVTFDKSGKLQLDSTVLSGMSATQVEQATAFLGASTTSGFLKNASDILTGLTDTDTGVIQSSIKVVTASITDEQDRIDKTQSRVDDLQTRLTKQMADADALIAKMEQQVTYYTALFQSYLDSQSNKNA